MLSFLFNFVNFKLLKVQFWIWRVRFKIYWLGSTGSLTQITKQASLNRRPAKKPVFWASLRFQTFEFAQFLNGNNKDRTEIQTAKKLYNV